MVTEAGNTSNASVATETSGGSKWSVRALDEADVTEDNLEKFFQGRYEDADKRVQELFLFVYCDCALNSMNKVPRERGGEKIDVKDYFEKFPAITCAMIKVVVLEDRKIQEPANGAPTGQAGGVAAGGENQRNTPMVSDVLPGTAKEKEKSKGGRPRGVLNFDKGMQGQWKIYTNTEEIDREAAIEGDDDKMTWYDAAVTEMDRKTATPTEVTSVETSSDGDEAESGTEKAKKDGKGNGSIDLKSMAFLKKINMAEV